MIGLHNHFITDSSLHTSLDAGGTSLDAGGTPALMWGDTSVDGGGTLAFSSMSRHGSETNLHKFLKQP